MVDVRKLDSDILNEHMFSEHMFVLILVGGIAKQTFHAVMAGFAVGRAYTYQESHD